MGGMDAQAPATDAILRAGHRLGSRGLISAGEGNVSVRLDADRILVTPSGLRKDELEAADLVVIWLGHPEREAWSRSGRRPTSTCRPR
jgi:ribulose-5-phosphate 4-epimerase/fuculose-1-phosphate aldolase